MLCSLDKHPNEAADFMFQLNLLHVLLRPVLCHNLQFHMLSASVWRLKIKWNICSCSSWKESAYKYFSLLTFSFFCFRRWWQLDLHFKNTCPGYSDRQTRSSPFSAPRHLQSEHRPAWRKDSQFCESKRKKQRERSLADNLSMIKSLLQI